MELNKTAKVQIHLGGVYGDKEKSLHRFISRYDNLQTNIRNRLIIENDDKSYSLKDCLKIADKTQIPVVFDVYHHECLNNGESVKQVFEIFTKAWRKEDGLPIIHYSSEHSVKGKLSHADHIDLDHFRFFLNKTKDYDFEIMLEIKDKEESALQAVKLLIHDPRL